MVDDHKKPTKADTATDAPQSRKPLRVGLIQMTASKSLDDNLDFLLARIDEAIEGGAAYILSPENSLIMNLDAKEVANVAGSAAYKDALTALDELARKQDIWLHIGASPIVLETKAGGHEAPSLANRSLLFAPPGRTGGTYDKIHMFDVALPGGESYRESKNYQPGEQAVVIDCGFAKLGMTICYDLRFPVLYRQLAQAGAEMISAPAAFTQITGEAHWHILLRSRAIETGCFVVAAAQTGLNETGRKTYWHSLVVSPWGEVLLDAGEDVGVFFAELDFCEVGDVRTRIPSLDHDRHFVMNAPL